MSNQFGVGDSSARAGVQDVLETSVVGQVAQVEGEHALVEVAEQVEGLNADVRALQTTFQQAPEVLKSVHVNSSVHVADGMVNDAMVVLVSELPVGVGVVRVNPRPDFNVLSDGGIKSASPRVLHDEGSDATVPITEAENRRLVDAARSRDLPSPLLQMHVPRLAADEALVHFDFARQPFEGLRLHGEPNAMENEPGGLLRDPESASEFVRADPVLAVCDKPDGDEPLVQADSGVLEDRADLDAELLLAALALPESARAEVGVFRPVAARTPLSPGPCVGVYSGQ